MVLYMLVVVVVVVLFDMSLVLYMLVVVVVVVLFDMSLGRVYYISLDKVWTTEAIRCSFHV